MSSVSAVSSASRRADGFLRSLSSGLRINTAADDPAGMVRASRLRSEMSALSVAGRSASAAVDFAAAVDGSLEEVSTILARLSELAVSASSSGGASEQQEVTQLLSQIDTIGKLTFGGKGAFSATPVTFQVGSSAADTVSFTTYALSSASLTDGSGAAVSLAAIDVSSSPAAAASSIANALSEVAALRAALGAKSSRASFARSAAETQAALTADAHRNLTAVDLPSAMAGFQEATLQGQYASMALKYQMNRDATLFNMLM